MRLISFCKIDALVSIDPQAHASSALSGVHHMNSTVRGKAYCQTHLVSQAALTSQNDHSVIVASSHVVVAGTGISASQLGTAPG